MEPFWKWNTTLSQPGRSAIRESIPIPNLTLFGDREPRPLLRDERSMEKVHDVVTRFIPAPVTNRRLAQEICDGLNAPNDTFPFEHPL
jgi:hypothetical protein